MYATKMLQSFKGLWVRCIKGAHTQREMRKYSLVCTCLNFRLITWPHSPHGVSQCHLSVDCLFHTSSDQRPAPQRKARPWIFLMCLFAFLVMCLFWHLKRYSCTCVCLVSAGIEIFNRAILMKAWLPRFSANVTVLCVYFRTRLFIF